MLLRSWSENKKTTKSESPAPPKPTTTRASCSLPNVTDPSKPHLRDLTEELLKQDVGDSNRKLKAILESTLFRGSFPAPYRLHIWKRLLFVKSDPVRDVQLAKAIRECVRDLPNQRVIRVDVERTRVDLPEFRKDATQELLTTLLTYFCKTRKTRYKQGLNEVLAPFVYLVKVDTYHSKVAEEALIFNLWVSFIDRFLPHLYDDVESVEGSDGEMIGLQCSFRFFELLLLYHDPELWHFLDRHRLKPELYASSWLMTMFAQNVPMNQAFELWESIMFGGDTGDAYLVHFVALAFLCSNRSSFLLSDPSDLPVLLTSRLSYHRGKNHNSSDSHPVMLLAETLKHTTAIAHELKKHTCDLFMWDIKTCLLVKTSPPSSRLLQKLGDKLVATCSAQFFWMGITGKLEDSTEIIVVDCRSRKEFDTKRPQARLVFHFGPEVVNNAKRLNETLQDMKRHIISGPQDGRVTNMPPSLARAWRWHICVIGTTCNSLMDISSSPMRLSRDDSTATIDQDQVLESDMDATMYVCVEHLLKNLLPCVSTVEGGWSQVLANCPDQERLLFPCPSHTESREDVVPPPKPLIPHRRPRTSYGDAVEDFDGGNVFVVSRASRGSPIKF